VKEYLIAATCKCKLNLKFATE